MAYWLLKTEPESWGWEHQKKSGANGEHHADGDLHADERTRQAAVR